MHLSRPIAAARALVPRPLKRVPADVPPHRGPQVLAVEAEPEVVEGAVAFGGHHFPRLASSAAYTSLRMACPRLMSLAAAYSSTASTISGEHEKLMFPVSFSLSGLRGRPRPSSFFFAMPPLYGGDLL